MADILELCCAARACMQLYRKTSKSKRSERYFWRIWSYHAHVASKCTSFSVSPLHRGHRNITAFSSVYRRLCVSIWLIPSLNLVKAFLICWFCITSKYFSFSKALLIKVLHTSCLPLDSSLECQFWMEQSLRRCWNSVKKRFSSPTDPFHQAKEKPFVHSKSRTAEAQFSLPSSAMLFSMLYSILTYLLLDNLFNLSQYFTHLVDARTDRWCLPSSP